MKRLQLQVAAGGYVAAFLWAYATVVSPAFAYFGYRLMWPDVGTMAWLIVLALLPALLLPYTLSRPSAFILWWLYLAAYVPSILVPALSLTMPTEKLLPLQISLLLCMGFLGVTASGRPLAIPRISLSPPVFWSAFLGAWLACFALVFLYGRISSVFVNLASLFAGGSEYAMRAELSDAISQTGRALAYAVSQLDKALNPYLVAFGLVYRRRACLIAGIIGQIVCFGLDGAKVTLFSTVFLLVLFVLQRRWRHSFGLALTIVLTSAVLLCGMADHAMGGVQLSSHVTRRTLAGPGLLTGFYFEHYSQVPHAEGLRDFRSGHGFGPPEEIGSAYFGSAKVSANANLWAAGFADFGVPGIFAFTVLVALVIWIFDSISIRHNLGLAVLVSFMPAVMFSNTAPTTVLISHGGIAATLMLYFSSPAEPANVHAPETIARTLARTPAV